MTIDELSARLERVESQNRWMRTGGLLAILLASAAAAIGQAAPARQVIQARRFEVIDGNGVVRGTFGTDTDGSRVELRLEDESKAYAGLYLDAGGFPWLGLVGPKKEAAYLSMPKTADGKGSLTRADDFDLTIWRNGTLVGRFPK